jgi:renalase
MDLAGLLSFLFFMTDLTGKRIAVIGAGLAGIAAAHALTSRNAHVTIFEKSRGYGGRCATKRWQGHVVDHGAQYFTLRDERFKHAVEQACGDAIHRLELPVRDEENRILGDTGRWFHRDGNSRLARDLAKGLEVRTETPVEDAPALLQAFDHVICTAPWPQTAKLWGLDEHEIDYIPCLAAVFAYRGDGLGRTQETYAFRSRSTPLAWTACENHKPGRIAAGSTVIVAHLGEEFSREHLERPPAEYPSLVRTWIEDRWELPKTAYDLALGHRWRLARIDSAHPSPSLPPRVHFVGDAFKASRVEDAWLAGHEWAAKNHLMD